MVPLVVDRYRALVDVLVYGGEHQLHLQLIEGEETVGQGVLPAVDACRGELHAHGRKALHLAVLGQMVAPLVGDNHGHQRVARDAAGEAVLASGGLHNLRTGVGGLRTGRLADGVPLLAHVHVRLLYLERLVLVPADDDHRLGAVALGVVPDGLPAGDAGGDAVGHALALARTLLLPGGTAGLGILAHAVHGPGHLPLGLPQVLVAYGQYLLLAEVKAQLAGGLGMQLLTAAAVYLPLEHLHHLVQAGDVGILGGDDGCLVGYHGVLLNDDLTQAVYHAGTVLFLDIRAPDALPCLCQLRDVLLLRHCRAAFIYGTKVTLFPDIRNITKVILTY